MPKKRIVSALIIVVLVVGVGIGASLAYLTDLKKEEITYAAGEVKVTLSGKGIGERADGLLPGKGYDKEPTVTISNGSEECYVRVQVSYPNAADLARIMLPPTPNAGWVRVRDSADQNTYYYYYEREALSNLSGGAQKTALPAFNKVVVSGQNPDPTQDHLEFLKRADQQVMQISVQAIQAQGLPAGINAQEAFERYY